MHVEFFVEEPSAAMALRWIVPKILGGEHTFCIHPFRDKQELLREIGSRLKAYSSWLPSDWHIVVLLDEDRQDCRELKGRVLEAAKEAGLAGRVLCRIAVEELESWYFGDMEALRSAYPKLPRGLDRKAKYREPDAIRGGTWEALDRLLRRYGYPAGLVKTEAARSIARHMAPSRNRSHSFQVFRTGLLRLVGESI